MPEPSTAAAQNSTASQASVWGSSRRGLDGPMKLHARPPPPLHSALLIPPWQQSADGTAGPVRPKGRHVKAFSATSSLKQASVCGRVTGLASPPPPSLPQGRWSCAAVPKGKPAPRPSDVHCPDLPVATAPSNPPVLMALWTRIPVCASLSRLVTPPDPPPVVRMAPRKASCMCI